MEIKGYFDTVRPTIGNLKKGDIFAEGATNHYIYMVLDRESFPNIDENGVPVVSLSTGFVFYFEKDEEIYPVDGYFQIGSGDPT